MTASAIAVSASLFRCTYLLLRKSAVLSAVNLPDSPECLSRYISCLHASALVILGLLWVNESADPGWWVLLARAVPIGYLIHDAHIVWAEPALWDASTLFHHAVFAVLVGLAAAPYPNYTALAFLAELSVPFLNAGWLMIKTGASIHWPRLFLINNLALLVTFLWFRVRTFTVLTIEAVILGVWDLLPLVVGLAGINWYWLFLLIRKAIALVSR